MKRLAFLSAFTASLLFVAGVTAFADPQCINNAALLEDILAKNNARAKTGIYGRLWQKIYKAENGVTTSTCYLKDRQRRLNLSSKTGALPPQQTTLMVTRCFKCLRA